ncbi:hypothetical protein BDQ17DRAFT_1341905 [Cyathus striatus]|nr:hypothetical protein BDQ17DRAFT_1341905 [Cyathus striatus]
MASSPTPLQSFLGGLTIPLPVHALMLLNGNVFGISGYVHRAVRGSVEALMGVTGLVLGGVAVGMLEGTGPSVSPLGLSQIILSGFLVGLGSKLANGCTSGHMICGIARFSVRSIAATATFFTTGVITARLVHVGLPATTLSDWTLGANGINILALQALPFLVAVGLYNFAPGVLKKEAPLQTNVNVIKAGSPPPRVESPRQHMASHETTISNLNVPNAPHTFLRGFAYLVTSFQFALALRLSNLTEARRVVSFLLLPVHKAFDSSLFFLAMGAMPLAILLYRYGRMDKKPRLGGLWTIPKGGKVDARLLLGAAIFGVGWGLGGVCPGPGLVNLGRAVASGIGLEQVSAWVGALVLGGLMV